MPIRIRWTFNRNDFFFICSGGILELFLISLFTKRKYKKNNWDLILRRKPLMENAEATWTRSKLVEMAKKQFCTELSFVYQCLQTWRRDHVHHHAMHLQLYRIRRELEGWQYQKWSLKNWPNCRYFMTILQCNWKSFSDLWNLLNLALKIFLIIWSHSWNSQEKHSLSL